MPAPSSHNIKELFQQLAEGDSKAFTEIFHYYSARLFPFVLKKVQEPSIAEEIVQDVFLKIWVNRERLRNVLNPEGYLYRIASNAVLDHFKKLTIEFRMLKSQSGSGDIDNSMAYSIQYRETAAFIEEAVHQLPPQRKKIWLLRENGLSYDEIATNLQLSVNTVKNQMVTASKFIRDYLLKKGISPLLIISLCFLIKKLLAE